MNSYFTNALLELTFSVDLEGEGWPNCFKPNKFDAPLLGDTPAEADPGFSEGVPIIRGGNIRFC